jgi:hypothetical protein
VVIVVGDGFGFGFFVSAFVFVWEDTRMLQSSSAQFIWVGAGVLVFLGGGSPGVKAINGVRTIRQYLGIPRRRRRTLVW